MFWNFVCVRKLKPSPPCRLRSTAHLPCPYYPRKLKARIGLPSHLRGHQWRGDHTIRKNWCSGTNQPRRRCWKAGRPRVASASCTWVRATHDFFFLYNRIWSVLFSHIFEKPLGATHNLPFTCRPRLLCVQHSRIRCRQDFLYLLIDELKKTTYEITKY